MPVNLELKARLRSLDDARSLAAALGARFDCLLVQTDTYYRVNHGRLKLRTFSGAPAELIMYDRPEVKSDRWSHYEVVPAGDGVALGRVLAESLGVRATVHKTRELHFYQGARIHLDEVSGLGAFIEFEVPAEDRAAARDLLGRLRDWFGLEEADTLQASYVDLFEAMGRGSTS